MELVELLRRWERVGEKVAWDREWRFETQEQRDRIVEHLRSESHYYRIHDDSIEDRGWLIGDWPARLEGLDPENSTLFNDPFCVFWVTLDHKADDLIDIGVREIVQQCYEQFPHVDTTPFVEFWHAACATFDDEAMDFDPTRPCGKPLLRKAYERALPVSTRIQMLIGYQPVTPTRVSIDSSTYTVTIRPRRPTELPLQIGPLAPHEAQYINALVEAKQSGDSYVTEVELKMLPGCNGRNITRDFNGTDGARPVKGIKQKYPKLWKLIGANNMGRYLKV